MNDHPNEDKSQLTASLCASLADPHQVLILCRLGHGEQTVGQLAGALGVSVQDIRQHIQTLCQSQLVVADYSWPTAQYRLSDHRLLDALDILSAVVQNALPDPTGVVALRPYLWAPAVDR